LGNCESDACGAEWPRGSSFRWAWDDHPSPGLGIMPGKIVTKVSSVFMRGPVVIVVDRVQVAIGFGMASRIIVALDLKK